MLLKLWLRLGGILLTYHINSTLKKGGRTMKINLKLGELSFKDGSAEGKMINAGIDAEYSLEEIQEINRDNKQTLDAIGSGIKFLLDNAPKYIKEIGTAIIEVKERNNNENPIVPSQS